MSLGNYRITHNTPFSSSPAIAITHGAGSGPRFSAFLSSGTGGFEFDIRNQAGQLVDSDFFVIAVPR